MSEEKEHIDNLIEHAEEYFKTRQELIKLTAAEKSSEIISTVFSSIIIFILFFFVIVFASIALAYSLSMYFGRPYSGFLAVALIYLIAALLFSVKRKAILETPMMNAMIKKFFQNDHNE